MYTEEQLNSAVNAGIFTSDAVAQFREHVSTSQTGSPVDEENFKLISGFNDIFVVIACALILVSSSWVIGNSSKALAMVGVATISWGLAEYFVRLRKMALPAIALLLSFVGGVFASGVELFVSLGEQAFSVAAAMSVLAAWLHWRRFRVPITVAAGSGAAIVFVISSLVVSIPALRDAIMLLIFIGGLIAFSLAIYWDASDRRRVSYGSDVAFWLHLLSAPLIVHPIFSGLGILSGSEDLLSIAIVVVLYLMMTLISLLVDRRIFMLSSLSYVLYALSTLLEVYGVVGYNFAITGLFLGLSLVLLSVYWHRARGVLLGCLPEGLKRYLPEL